MYKAFIAVFAATLLSAVVKTIIEYFQGIKFSFDRLGGMPSTHAAAVASLATAVYFEQRFSLLLLACIVFGWVVVRDAYGVRWEVTQHSVALNKLTKSELYKRTGHTKVQVAVGVLLGMAVATIVYLI